MGAGTALAALLGACTTGEPADAIRGLAVHGAWARLADSGATSGAYLTLVNADTVARTLVRAHSPWARATEVHETMQHQGMTHMQARPSLPIAAGDSLVLAPGGLHLMLIDLTRAVAVGDTVPLTLHFADGDSLVVRAPVRAP
jgi:copper(I)-binding protein